MNSFNWYLKQIQLNVRLENSLLDGCPFLINVKADTSKIQLIAAIKFAPLYEPIEICVCTLINLKVI